MATEAQQGVTDGSWGRTEFKGGAVRSDHVAGAVAGKFPPRYDLISHVGLRRLAETYGEGAAKYDPGNWLKGIPAWDLMNRVAAHWNAYKSGDRSEDHLAHAAWNLFALMHFEEVTNLAEEPPA